MNFRIQPKTWSIVLAVGNAILLLNATVNAQTIYKVDIDGSASNWDSNANEFYPSLQALLSDPLALSNNDQVWIAEGTYTPDECCGAGGDREVSFVIENEIEVYGGFASGETDKNQRDHVAHRTKLSGEINDPNDITDNSFVIIDAGDNEVRLDSLEIREANATPDDDPFPPLPDEGAGLLIESGNVVKCNFRANDGMAPDGGAVVVRKGGFGSPPPQFYNCMFINNGVAAVSEAESGAAFFTEVATPLW